MFYYIFYPLKDYFIIFNLFRYITFRSMAAFVTAFIIGIMLGPKFISYVKKIGVGQSERNFGPESHLVKEGTPTMGGVFIIISSLFAILLWSTLNCYAVIVTFAMLLFGLIGFIDDYRKFKYKNSDGLSARLKLVFQIIVSFVLIFLLYLYPDKSREFFAFYIPFYSQPLFYWYPILGFVFYVFVIVAFSNATNLSDGLDGLAAGMSIMLIIPFGIFAYVIGNLFTAEYLKFAFIPGSGELSVVLSALSGGIVAFLWYNVHPAEVFMGDTGSLSIGGTIALVAIIIKQEMLLVIAGGMFVLEAFSVVLQVFWYKKFGKRIFRMSPIHHHFELSGWKETQVVVRFWIISALLALVSLTALKIR